MVRALWKVTLLFENITTLKMPLWNLLVEMGFRTLLSYWSHEHISHLTCRKKLLLSVTDLFLKLQSFCSLWIKPCSLYLKFYKIFVFWLTFELLLKLKQQLLVQFVGREDSAFPTCKYYFIFLPGNVCPASVLYS